MSDKAIATCAFITLGSTFGGSVAPKPCGKGDIPDFKLLIGTSLTFLSLSVMDNFAPKIATLLSVSLALTATMYYAVPTVNCYLTGKASEPIKDSPAEPDTPVTYIPGVGNFVRIN